MRHEGKKQKKIKTKIQNQNQAKKNFKNKIEGNSSLLDWSSQCCGGENMGCV